MLQCYFSKEQDNIKISVPSFITDNTCQLESEEEEEDSTVIYQRCNKEQTEDAVKESMCDVLNIQGIHIHHRALARRRDKLVQFIWLPVNNRAPAGQGQLGNWANSPTRTCQKRAQLGKFANRAATT